MSDNKDHSGSSGGIIGAVVAVLGVAGVAIFKKKKRHFDKDGYDQYGYDRDGYDRDGYDRDGYDRDGYDRDGYDRAGYDRDGYDRDGYNREGYNRHRVDRDGYDRAGYKDGYDRNGLDRQGYNRQGYNVEGVDRVGNNSAYYRQEFIKLRQKLSSAKKSLDKGEYTHAMIDSRQSLEHALIMLIEHKKGSRMCGDGLLENLKICEKHKIVDNVELVDKLHDIRRICKSVHDIDADQVLTHQTVYFVVMQLNDFFNFIENHF